MKKLIFLLSILIPVFAFGQSESKKATDILKKLEKKVDSYKSLYIEYNILVENQQLKTQERQEGKVTAQKNKFQIVANKELEVYCDGKTKWTYMKDVQEINIQNVDSDADDIFSDPVKFLTGQRKDFKYYYKGLVQEDGKTYTEIDYYPKNIKAPYSYIRLHVNEDTLMPYSIKYHSRDGVHYTIRLKIYLPDVDVSNVNFTFDPSKYPNIEVVDLR
ncbi:MAG: outer membrane lipoprotein carrier protein LolA [Prevotellaceae bacterium]|jgi:outer membrane lipoprotein-sorting protein|nr:outer membrane lipoprotein carrier protein LolA [Prevotellaceae bacterium]